jgi:hypothetical protein
MMSAQEAALPPSIPSLPDPRGESSGLQGNGLPVRLGLDISSASLGWELGGTIHQPVVGAAAAVALERLAAARARNK